MIKWYLTPSQARRRTRLSLPSGRAAIAATLVLSTLALAPPRATRVSPTAYRSRHNSAAPYAAVGMKLPSHRTTNGGTVPD
jgi:hypothetical protein